MNTITKPVAAVRPGDHVLRSDGRITRVVAASMHQVRSGRRERHPIREVVGTKKRIDWHGGTFSLIDYDTEVEVVARG